MATKFRLEINVPGFNEARTDPAVQEDLHRRGEAIANAAGGEPDFEVTDAPNSTRARVFVRTASFAGMRAEATDQALTRAFDAGRG
ncbi:hypothetical protein [Cryobacterium zongtaii]|nr:hypothetical protein [Cryobacterium zongtaii]